MTEQFEKALVYANLLHRNQKRKSTGCPYISHLLAVSALVMDFGGDEDEAIAALLHDAVEDQGGHKVEPRIRRMFGDRVTDIVLGCSEDKFSGLTWKQRKQAAIEALANSDASVVLVQSADKLHNIRSLNLEYRQHGETIWKLFKGGKEGSLWYYRAMTDAITQFSSGQLADELELALSELESAVNRNQVRQV